MRMACNEVMLYQGLFKNPEHSVQLEDVCQFRTEKVPVQKILENKILPASRQLCSCGDGSSCIRQTDIV